MINPEIIRAIGLRVALEARQEHLAIRMMKSIEASGFLRHHAPGLAEGFEAILADEARHLKLLTDCAKRYGVDPASVADVADLSVALTYPPWVQLRHIYTVEWMSKFGFRLNIQIHETVTGDQEAVAMYRAIAVDELRHLAIGSHIHHVLLKVPRFREDFRKLQTAHVVEQAYRATFGERSFILQRFGLEPGVGHTTIPRWEGEPDATEA
jgi:hypothetical protein